MAGKNNIKNPIIHYSQCWEDTALLIEALDINTDDNVLSVGSGGDNSFALLLRDPKILTIIDSNPAQVYLIELKIRAMEKLNFAEFISFIGIKECKKRSKIYLDIRPYISIDAQEYWDRNLKEIKNGIIHCGKFEYYFSIFRRFILPVIHNNKNIDGLLNNRTINEQKDYYDRLWNNKRWALLFRFFFSRFILGRFGRDPSFFKYVNNKNISAEILKRTKRGLTAVEIQNNFYVEYILKGHYKSSNTPHYLQEESFNIIKERLHKIRLLNAGLSEYLNDKSSKDITKFNLSDIFEYISEPDFENLVGKILKESSGKALMTFWTLFIPRKVPAMFKENIMFDSELSNELFDKNRSFFYGTFNVWRINKS